MSFNAYYMLRSLDDKHFKSRFQIIKKSQKMGLFVKV